jgi:hypothetical protein
MAMPINGRMTQQAVPMEPHKMAAKKIADTIERRDLAKVFFMVFKCWLHEMQPGNDDVNGLDADERNDNAPQAVHEQVALQNGQRADGRKLDAT